RWSPGDDRRNVGGLAEHGEEDRIAGICAWYRDLGPLTAAARNRVLAIQFVDALYQDSGGKKERGRGRPVNRQRAPWRGEALGRRERQRLVRREMRRDRTKHHVDGKGDGIALDLRGERLTARRIRD